MAIIETHTPETADGEVKEILDTVMGLMNTIPGPMELASASPWMIKNVWASVQYFSEHPNLGFGLLSAIRYLVARETDFAFCTGFNKNFLQMQGMSDEDIDMMAKDPSKAPLDDNDRALLAFVAKAIKDQEAVTQADMDHLHDLGWTDRDILEAMAHGANMIASGILMKTFKMDVAC
jgi:alkylhydroperoxidase family enzyme